MGLLRIRLSTVDRGEAIRLLPAAGLMVVLIVLMPSEDVDVIDVMPAMVESCRSIGPATEAAIVSGLAPGRVAVIWMVGKSTAGNAATESRRYAKNPKTISEAVSSVVMTGRRMQVSEICIRFTPRLCESSRALRR